MSEKNIQIKLKNEATGLYDIIYPKTKAELVDGLSTLLAEKVDKIAGKQLSTEDFTSTEKSKLSGIETGANKYVHPANHPATMITQSSSHRFVSDTQIATWNGKVDATYVSSEIAKLVDGSPEALNTLKELSDALGADPNFATTIANQIGEKYTKPVSGIPLSDLSSGIQNQLHAHTNKAVLDKLKQTGAETEFDLSNFVTKNELGNAGYGDMLKSVYDTNGNGKVDHAEVADSVAWTGVSGKPTTFPPSSHGHNASEITESTSKRFVSDTEKSNWNGKSKVVMSTTQPSDANVWFHEV